MKLRHRQGTPQRIGDHAEDAFAGIRLGEGRLRSCKNVRDQKDDGDASDSSHEQIPRSLFRSPKI
jgi:hypothetical protein